MVLARRAVPVSLWVAAIAAVSACGTSSDAPSTAPNERAGDGGFVITVSGEDLVATGYDFGPDAKADGDPPAFVDGWSVKFDHALLTVGAIRINADPEKDDANAEDVGALVAEDVSSYAVDLVKGGAVEGKSGSPEERAAAITAFANTGGRFDPKARYAFRYDTLVASAGAKRVNFTGDAEANALYDDAIAKGYSMVLSGTATFQGPSPAPGTVFASLPKSVKFTLGLTNPSSYINCRNTDFAQVGDEFPRGIQSKSIGSTVVQITMHTDHIFWNKLNVEGATLHFDPIAAQAQNGVVTTDDLRNVDVTAFRTRGGEPLPARSLVSDYSPEAGPLRFDPNGTTFSAVNSYASFLSYSASFGGHMNADGECEVRNRFTP